MRLLLDLQCVQSTSAERGIGRYALSLSAALVATAGPDDQVEVLLNGGDDAVRLVRARAALETFLPAGAVHVFDAPWPWHHDPSPVRRTEAEAVRAAAVASLAPDAVLLGSVFEGDKENVLSVEPDGPPTAALLYDLIPAADPGTYLLGPGADSYWRRFEEMKRVDLLLSISAYSGRQAQDLLGDACPPVVPVWGGPYPSGLFATFETRAVAATSPPPERFLLAVGGDHPRKNLDRLVQAWGAVPPGARAGTSLVVACRLNVGTVRRLRRLARRAGLQPHELVLTGEVSEEHLVALYEQALAFVFPSTEEGLGMPPLEAMAAGCPCLLARGSSLSELLDDDSAFFDGTDVADMARALARVLADDVLRDHLRHLAREASTRFTWTRAAELAWDALRRLPGRPAPSAAPGIATESVVLVPEVPRPPHDDAVAAAEHALGVVSPSPVGVRTALVGADVLLVQDDSTARELVAAGLLEQPVLTDPAQLALHRSHDVYPEVRRRLPAPAWPDDLVDALSSPPRWSLERPWPVVLLLTDAPGDADHLRRVADEHGAVLVVGGRGAAVLARGADHVLVDGDTAQDLLPELRAARCAGAVVTVLGDVPAPSWCRTAPSAGAALRQLPLPRTTGWPWRPRA